MKEVDYRSKTIQKLSDDRKSSMAIYQELVVGSKKISYLLTYEMYTLVAKLMPGAVGLMLRRYLSKALMPGIGKKVIIGENVSLRCPQRIRLKNGVGIDDGCLVDARGAGPDGIQIDEDVIISRNTLIQAKHGPIKIGRKTTIGANCIFSAISDISIGCNCIIAARCYIGGGSYHNDRKDIPMWKQGVYSQGSVRLEDDVWIGANATILDNVEIGRGCIVGAGSVVNKNLAEYSVAVGIPAQVIRKR